MSNFWRTSHFLLAAVAGIPLLLAALTGIILSTEPIHDKVVNTTSPEDLSTISLAEFIEELQDEFIEVFSIEKSKNNGIIVDVVGWDEEKDGRFYIHPKSLEKTGEVESQKRFYSWTTSLHRSLFLHNTGRIIMGVSVFLLLLMTISGLALIFKQTQGFKKLFSRINKQSSYQYNHTVLGRLSFLGMFLMALGGSVMFINTQFPFPEGEIKTFVHTSKEHLDWSEFEVFSKLTLDQVEQLHFPFSEDEEDEFELTLSDRKLTVHQYSGEITSEQVNSTAQEAYSWAEVLHTGRGNIIWAIILLLVSLNILYFIYSGAKISWKRLSSKTSNKFTAEQAEFILLVGSENGSTQAFSTQLFKALHEAKKRVFIDTLNNYQSYPKGKHLLVLTSTYGDGEPPYNAKYFLSKLKNVAQPNVLEAMVIGFGSMSYPKFCQYAIDVQEKLEEHPQFKVFKEAELIHGQSHASFKAAIDKWQNQHQITIQLPEEEKNKNLPCCHFKVVNKKVVDDGYTLTFTLELETESKAKYQAGDLLAITPPGDTVARYYSMGILPNGNIILSIRKHEFGLCSTYLYEQEVGDFFPARLKVNADFHFPKKNDVILIGNGTGVAPFIGMNPRPGKQSLTRILGGRVNESYLLYEENLLKTRSANISNYLALSKQSEKHKYVQDLLIHHQSLLIKTLQNKGTIMICGSVKMRDGVLQEIKSIITRERVGLLENFIENRQILMDCY